MRALMRATTLLTLAILVFSFVVFSPTVAATHEPVLFDATNTYTLSDDSSGSFT